MSTFLAKLQELPDLVAWSSMIVSLSRTKKWLEISEQLIHRSLTLDTKQQWASKQSLSKQNCFEKNFTFLFYQIWIRLYSSKTVSRGLILPYFFVALKIDINERRPRKNLSPLLNTSTPLLNFKSFFLLPSDLLTKRYGFPMYLVTQNTYIYIWHIKLCIFF